MARKLSIEETFAKQLKALERRCARVSDSLDAYVNKQPTPPLIYHYTDSRGLKGILQSGKLWLSDLYSMNDPSEMRHSVDRGLEKIAAMVRQIGRGRQNAMLADLFVKDIKAGLEDVAHQFVGSFSRTADDIHQWQTYADDCRGFALVFDTDALETAFAEATPSTAAQGTFSVLYDDARRDRLHDKLCTTIAPIFERYQFDGRATRSEVGRAVDILYTSIVHFIRQAIVFKHTAYKSEQEYRFFRAYAADHPRGPILTRRRRGERVKYIEFDWRAAAPHSLKKIIVGSAAEIKAAHMLLVEGLKRHPTRVAIEDSDIPYRRLRR